MELIDFGNGVCLDGEQIDKAVNAVIAAIKKELPEEVLCVSVVNAILEETKKQVGCRKVNL